MIICHAYKCYLIFHLLPPPSPPPCRLRYHDGRLHDVHQRVHLHHQLPAHQPPHCVRPAQPLQLLRAKAGGGVGEGVTGQDKLRFSINMSSWKKNEDKKKSKCFFVNFLVFSELSLGLRRFFGWGEGVKGEYRCLSSPLVPGLSDSFSPGDHVAVSVRALS